MAIPAAALAAGSKILGPVIGAFGQNAALNRGMRRFADYTGQGTQGLEGGKAASDLAFSPYTSTGATAAQGQLDAIQNRTQAAQPTLSATDPSGVAKWLNPQATWVQNQATKAATAAGVATGGTGGGMQRAISVDANQRAQANWNDAYNQMLQANNQNFDQQQTQYQNQTAFDQSQIQNLGDVANRGVSATGSNQQLQLGYNTGINQNFGRLADNTMTGWASKGQLFNNVVTGLGDNLSGMFSQLNPVAKAG